jgi:aspartyl-tRNA(Asn)/glutamyl-tRNA(Gln) amidotransferase subunit C
MTLTREQIAHITELARLDLTDTEIAVYQKQLSAILEYAEQLESLDTDAIPPTATVLPVRNVMRDDQPCPSMSREDILANAPEIEDGCFRVDAVLD